MMDPKERFSSTTVFSHLGLWYSLAINGVAYTSWVLCGSTTCTVSALPPTWILIGGPPAWLTVDTWSIWNEVIIMNTVINRNQYTWLLQERKGRIISSAVCQRNLPIMMISNQEDGYRWPIMTLQRNISLHLKLIFNDSFWCDPGPAKVGHFIGYH